MKPFYLLLILATLIACNQSGQTKSNADKTTSSAIASVKTVQLEVKGMTCEGCENTIESALTNVDGVVSAEALHTAGTATVTFDTTKVNLDLITQTIDKTGYEVVK